jgi:hypothetical protein
MQANARSSTQVLNIFLFKNERQTFMNNAFKKQGVTLTSNKDSSRQGLFVCVGKLKFEGKIRSN